MDVDLLKAIWNGMEMDVDPYVDPHVDFVEWFGTLVPGRDMLADGMTKPLPKGGI